MMVFVIVVHAIVCLALIVVVLIQSGRGGGLVESFSGIESMFGTKTNVFLTRVTNVLSVLFFITCLSLAFLSLKQSRSLMRDVKLKQLKVETAQLNQTVKPQPTEEAKVEQKVSAGEPQGLSKQADKPTGQTKEPQKTQ